MLHDRMMFRNTGPGGTDGQAGGEHQPTAFEEWMELADATAVDDRRSSDRLPYPGELMLAWNHDLRSPMRYSLVDAGDGGYRIRSSLPMLEGTTGMALRLLPEGTTLDQPVMVVWCEASTESGSGYEIGLRCF